MVKTCTLLPARLRHKRRILQNCDRSSSFFYIIKQNVNYLKVCHKVLSRISPELTTIGLADSYRNKDDSKLDKQYHLYKET